MAKKRTLGLKLTVELVPKTCWYKNMRSILSESHWDTIRKQVYEDSNYRCGICQATGTLHCHEMWQYDDENHVQTLNGFVALCEMCHHVKHLGYAQVMAKKGNLDFESVIRHFMDVNGCDRLNFQLHSLQAFKVWRERSQHKWKIDLGACENLIKSR